MIDPTSLARRTVTLARQELGLLALIALVGGALWVFMELADEVLEGETVKSSFLTKSQWRSNREVDQCRNVDTTNEFIEATLVTSDVDMGFTPPFKVQN